MLNKQKTREGEGAFAGSRTGDLENNRQEEGSNFLPASQGKCVRCPYFPGKGYACNLVPCPFTEPGACLACVHFLPVNEHRNKARCVWTGERLDAGEVERVRECIGFELREEGLTSAGACGNLVSPKYNERRTANAISFPPRKGRSTRTSIAESSAYHALLGATRRERGYIGRVQRPVSVKTRQPLVGLGSVVPCLSFYPQNNEVPHA